jgi:PAS domain S-box-containing protein
MLFCVIYIFLNYFIAGQHLIPIDPEILQRIRFLNYVFFFAFLAAYSFYYRIASRYTERQVVLQNIKLEEAHTLLQKESEERKHALSALQRSEEIFRTIVTNSLPIIFCIDKNGIFTLSEGKSLEALGLNPGELVGKSIQKFSKDYPDIFKGVQVAIEGKIFNDTICFQGAKEEVFFDVFYSPYRDSQGQIIGSIVIANDITERKKAERENKKLAEQLQRAEKMEALGTLAGGVAHDLNNILAGIVGYPDLLLMELPEENPLRKPLEIIKESGQKAAEIVQDLLTLARRGVSKREVVNLNNIIREYWQSPEFKQLQSFHPNVHFDLQTDGELFNIQGSRIHLFKIVMNLISNAAEAIPKEGNVLVATENRYIDRPFNSYERVADGDYVVLSVSDTGVGISADDKKRIFEPFYTKKVMGRSGTGLGLSVVWGTVKDHNGFIDLVSEEGQGTMFTLFFPVTHEHQEQEEKSFSLNDCRGHGETILVVDDVPEQRNVASQMLTFLGYSVTTLESGEAAVEFMCHHTVDLLLLDMIMAPGMDGLDCYREIIKKHPCQKAVIASGYSETQRVRELQNLGAGAYLKKPYTIDKLAKIIKSELQKISDPDATDG